MIKATSSNLLVYYILFKMYEAVTERSDQIKRKVLWWDMIRENYI